MFLVLIFTRGWVNPRAMVWSEGNMSLKNPVTPPGIDPRTVQLVAQCLKHYATPGPIREYYRTWNIGWKYTYVKCYPEMLTTGPSRSVVPLCQSTQHDTPADQSIKVLWCQSPWGRVIFWSESPYRSVVPLYQSIWPWSRLSPWKK